MASTKSEKASIDMCFIDLNYASELETNLRDYGDSRWKPIIISGKYEEKIIEVLKNKRNCNVFLYIDPYVIQALDSELFDRLRYLRGFFVSQHMCWCILKVF